MRNQKVLVVVCIFLALMNLFFLGIVTNSFGKIFHDQRTRNIYDLYYYREKVKKFLEEMSPEDRKLVSQEKIFNYLQSIKKGKGIYTVSLGNDAGENKRTLFIYSLNFDNAVHIDIP